MREESLLYSVGWIKYPDEIAFAYNPNYIEIARATNMTSAVVTITNPIHSASKSINAVIVGGAAKVYISRIMQLLLTDGRCQSLSISVVLNGDGVSETHTFQTYAIDGSIDLGQRFGEIGCYVYDADEVAYTRRMRWFKNYPSVLSLFIFGSAKMKMRIDGTGYTYETNLSGYNFQDLDPANTDYPLNSAINTAVVKLEPSVGGGSTFDNTYDYTFFKLTESTQLIRLTVDNSKEGYFLRWTDPIGYKHDFLFSRGTRTMSVSDGSSLNDEVTVGGINYPIQNVISKTRTMEVKCAAMNLTNEEYRYVCTIASAIDVEWYVGNGQWLPVNVKAGSYEVSERADMADFEINLEIPISQTKSL